MKVYRYFVTYECLTCYEVEVVKETPSYFFLAEGSFIGSQKRTKISKKEDGKVILKDSAHYPYIDFYSTENQSIEFAVENIMKYFMDKMTKRR